MTKVRVSEQVESFVKALAPEPRRKLRQAIKLLAEGKGDVRHLEADLTGWSRLRVGAYRVVFKESFEGGTRLVDCIYANRRSVVYDMFAQILRNELLRELENPPGQPPA